MHYIVKRTVIDEPRKLLVCPLTEIISSCERTGQVLRSSRSGLDIHRRVKRLQQRAEEEEQKAAAKRRNAGDRGGSRSGSGCGRAHGVIEVRKTSWNTMGNGNE